jgi:hypothetical protein
VADKKSKKPVAKKADPASVMIVIGGKATVKHKKPASCQLWMLDGEEVTDDGDRRSVACLTSADLYALGWVRRKH